MIGGSNQGVFKTEGGQIYWYPETRWSYEAHGNQDAHHSMVLGNEASGYQV